MEKAATLNDVYSLKIFKGTICCDVTWRSASFRTNKVRKGLEQDKKNSWTYFRDSGLDVKMNLTLLQITTRHLMNILPRQLRNGSNDIRLAHSLDEELRVIGLDAGEGKAKRELLSQGEMTTIYSNNK